MYNIYRNWIINNWKKNSMSLAKSKFNNQSNLRKHSLINLSKHSLINLSKLSNL